MAVYVDNMMSCVKNIKWRWPSACHLIADSVDELHTFAKELGLKGNWYQCETIPHYDLTGGMRRKAVALGAVEIGREELVERIQEYRRTQNE